MRSIVIPLVVLAALVDLSAAVEAFPVSPLHHLQDPRPSPRRLNMDLGIGLAGNCYLMRESGTDPTPRGQTDSVRECD